VDMIRSASRGKEFWRAEAVGGAEWSNRRPGQGHNVHQDQMADPAEIRLDALISFAGGANGYINPRWRPLFHGPLFGAYGWYGMDGSRTERSEMVAEIAAWANDPAQDGLWKAQPLRGDIALLLIEDAQARCYVAHGDTSLYARSLQGAYEAFLHSNIQCDIVRIDQIAPYKMLYLPYPVALSNAMIEALKAWVEQGGILISEACIGYFDEMGRAYAQQPSRGLAEWLGCKERTISFAPDRWDTLSFETQNGPIQGGIYRQSYHLEGGTARGWFEDGEIAVVDNLYGQGRTRLVGTMPGYAYKTRPDEATRKWFADLLDWAGETSHLTVTGPAEVVGRLWRGENAYYLWAVNLGSNSSAATFVLSPALGDFTRVQTLRGADPQLHPQNTLIVQIEGRDATVLQLA
jgi:beta-galactosidase